MLSDVVDAQLAAGDKMGSAGEVWESLPPMRKLENAEGLFCDMIANYREMEAELGAGSPRVGRSSGCREGWSVGGDGRGRRMRRCGPVLGACVDGCYAAMRDDRSVWAIGNRVEAGRDLYHARNRK